MLFPLNAFWNPILCSLHIPMEKNRIKNDEYVIHEYQLPGSFSALTTCRLFYLANQNFLFSVNEVYALFKRSSQKVIRPPFLATEKRQCAF